ncbi:hypothetical protein [Maribacter stanieri]|uniref:Uncharacterized protein n=1 Tax=Maribacter stanieri TaxID=440514 RepID=A0A1I6JV13_9FLAO|nr:hypothetical protein [Maribacter stanieri]SFR82797.1 hypothetical protein SAMN04488010_3081 [Maribacter stanieri]
MEKFLDPILLKEEFIFNGTIDELNEKIHLNNDKKFRTKWSEYNRFEFFAKWSLGTLIFRGFPTAVDGIKGFAELTRKGEYKTHVLLKTKVRIEFYFFLIILTTMCVAGLATQSDFPIYLLLLIPFGLLWFWFIYRVQEKMLFRKLRKYLNEEKTHYNKT